MLKYPGYLLLFVSNLCVALQIQDTHEQNLENNLFGDELNIIQPLEPEPYSFDSETSVTNVPKDVRNNETSDYEYLQQLKREHELKLVEAQNKDKKATIYYEYNSQVQERAGSTVTSRVSGAPDSDELIKQSLEAMGIKQQVKHILEETKEFRQSIGLSGGNRKQVDNKTYTRERVYNREPINVNPVSDVSTVNVSGVVIDYDEFTLWDFLVSIKWKLFGFLVFIIFLRIFVKLVSGLSRRKRRYRRI